MTAIADQCRGCDLDHTEWLCNRVGFAAATPPRTTAKRQASTTEPAVATHRQYPEK